MASSWCEGVKVVGSDPSAAGSEDAKGVVVDICKQSGDVSIVFVQM